ncbi:EAL domain-containing protein [Alkalilimnicola ehrlichii MLHE-1]|nr:EAL domain-containing protein [Alkalilimnicola ehrlichii]
MRINRRLVWGGSVMVWGLVLLALYGNWQDKVELHHERQQGALEIAYQSTVNTFQLAAQAYLDEAVARPEVLDLMRVGQETSDAQAQAVVRGRLYRALWPTYQRLHDGELRELHLHTADGRSFLRFFAPEYYGDDLLTTRPLVRQVHQTRRPASGFETGRSLSGFRYVYPLFDGDEFLGSVEFSIPFRYVREMMDRLDQGHEFQLMLRRERVEERVPPGFLALYEPAPLHPGFVVEDAGLRLPDSPPPPSAEVLAISDKLGGMRGVRATIDAGAADVVPLDFAGQTWAAVLLPIHDPAGELVAYVVSFAPDPFSRMFRWDFIRAALVATLLLGAVLMLLLRVLHSREVLRGERAYQQAITDTMADGLYAQDKKGRLTFINPVGRDLLGYREEDVLGRRAHALFHQHDDDGLAGSGQCPLERRVAAGRYFEGEETFRRRDGSEIPVEVSSRPLYQGGHWAGSVTLFRDITERRRARARLKLAASVFTSANEGILITDPQARILMVNQAFTRITGYHQDEVEGRDPKLLASGRHGPEFFQELWRVLDEHDHWQGELWNRRKSGELYLQLITISAVRDESGRLINYVGLLSDITDMKAYQRKLEFLTHYDPLTELPNRVLLLDRLRKAMQLAQREQRRVCVAYVDLDDFKTINDVHGHRVGDQVLLELASRLSAARREGDTASRLSGDEFAMVFVNLGSVAECHRMAARVLDAVARPITIEGVALQTSASIGVAHYPQDEEVDAEQLLRQADQAMYQAKLQGKNRHHVFDVAGDRQLRDQHESLTRLELALARGEFVLHYQPKVNLRTREVVGAEALIRWQHPERGLLPPAAFLDDLNGQPLEVAVSRWVMARALEQVETWSEQGVHLPVSVNVPALHLQQADFVDQIRELLARHPGLPRNSLELEILESSALASLDHVSRVIQGCAALGVDFSLDDFGTGYASLSYLKRIPVRIVKIDRSFVRDMLEDADDLALLEGIVRLTQVFDLQLIAEGVETPEQGERLLELGCEQAQGYGIGRPMPAGSLLEWLSAWQRQGGTA